jgi:TRAP-type C4-dicarboxylate transport system permease small subunit
MIKTINNWLAEICGWLLIVMIVFLCADILARGIRDPIQGAAEIAVFIMISAIYLGLSHCEQMNRHIKVTALLERMPVSLQKIIRVFNYSIIVPITAILLWSAGSNLIYAYQSQVALSGTVTLLLWPVRLVMLIGIFFFFIQVILTFVESIKEVMIYYRKI